MLNFLKHHWTRRDKLLAKIRTRQVALGVLIGCVCAGSFILWQTDKDNLRRVDLRQEAQQVDPQHTLPPNTKPIGGSFTATDQNGKTVSDADFRGKYMLVYFGYTFCPDMCPTGLSSITHALDQIGAEAAAKVQPVFITIDPERDTPAKLKEYIASFYPSIVALSGTAAQTAEAAKAYQVYYTKTNEADGEDYMMDHSSLIYLMDPQGHFITTFNEDADPAVLVKALQAQGVGPSQVPNDEISSPH